MKNMITVSLDPAWVKRITQIELNLRIRSEMNLQALLHFGNDEPYELPHADYVLVATQENIIIPVWEWVHQLKKRFITSKIILFLHDYSDPLDTILIKRLAERYGIHLAPPYLSVDEFEQYMKLILGLTDAHTSPVLAPLIVGWGTSPRVGVTTILTHAAHRIAITSKKRVGMMDLNFRAPDLGNRLGIEESIKDFLLLQSDASAKMLTPQALRQSMIMSKKTPNLSFLLSSHRREYSALITADEIDELLKVARQTYDIVFVDVNSYPDNAATLRAVKQADERWVITDTNNSSYQTAWQDWYESVWEPYGLVLSDFGLVINNISVGKEGTPSSAISKLMGIPLYGELPDIVPSSQSSPPASWNNSMDLLLQGTIERLQWKRQPATKAVKTWTSQMRLKWKTVQGVFK